MKINLYILTLISCLISCQEKPTNFLLDDFPKLVTEVWNDKPLLEKFKETPLETAISDRPEFKKAFYCTSEILMDQIDFEEKFKKSLEQNGIEHWDTSNNLLIFAFYHKKINGQKFSFSELKEFTDLIYLKYDIVNRDNSRLYYDNDNCYIKELTDISHWLIDSLERIDYVDADLLLNASNKLCKSNVEFLEVYNETLFNCVNFIYMEYIKSIAILEVSYCLKTSK